MKLLLSFTAFVLILFTSCIQLEDEKLAVLNDTRYNDWLLFEYGFKSWQPTKKDRALLDTVLVKAIKNKFDFYKEPIIKHTYDYYYIQYVPYLNNDGHKIIKVNALCEVPKETITINGKYRRKEADWRNEYISVQDGGSCYWRVTINIDTMEYDDFIVNGN